MRASIHRRRGRARALLAALGCGLLSCNEHSPERVWPVGSLLSADTRALAGLLDAISELEHTPLGRRAAELRTALPECAKLEAYAPDGDPRALFASLRCADPSGPLAAFHAARGEVDLTFALPGAPGRRVQGAADLDGAGARFAVTWPVQDGVLAGLLPGDAPAGADRLAGVERVAHAHLRAAGPLDLAALVPEGSQGDRLFRLRSELFGVAVLDGSVELALYLPEDGAEMPRVAAALGVRHAGAAGAAVEQFLDEIESAWSLRRVPFEQGAARGACLPDLHLVPELAPCYALTDAALVLGWNPASLQHALASGAPGADSESVSERAAARFDIDLAGVTAADARLATVHRAERPALRWPWRRVRAEITRRSDDLEIELDLEPASAS